MQIECRTYTHAVTSEKNRFFFSHILFFSTWHPSELYRLFPLSSPHLPVLEVTSADKNQQVAFIYPIIRKITEKSAILCILI